jgi:predicted transcriptional regulator
LPKDLELLDIMLIFAAHFLQKIYSMNIKAVISRKGFTMQQVADKLGISQQAVSQAVNGNPSLSRLKDIADAIGVTVSELVADDEQSTHTATCPHCGHEIEITIELK